MTLYSLNEKTWLSDAYTYAVKYSRIESAVTRATEMAGRANLGSVAGSAGMGSGAEVLRCS